ncbi:MAG: hypothetical protein K6F30_06945 [Lachnospiraceae bacterium]|nr:hypothetical protein [Lachnospiraceae bacterium]
MGELIYCRKPIAANPFYIDEVGLNVYSLEELSYFIFHNPYLLDTSLCSMDLIQWIMKELDEKDVANQLKELLAENAPFHMFVGRLLSSCGYLTQAEIRQTMELVAFIENKSEGERKKIRADRLMEKNKIEDAIYEYENILLDTKDLSNVLIGDIYHNLGTAYARLFFFQQAITNFEKAYSYNQRKDSLKSMFYAIRCNRNELQFESAVQKYNISEEEAERYKTEVTEASTCQEITAYGKQMDELRSNYSSEELYEEHLNEMILDIQSKYNSMCRM